MNIFANMLPTRKRRKKRRRSARMAAYHTTIARPTAQGVPLVPAMRWLGTRLAGLVFLAAVSAILVWFFWSYDFYVYGATITGNQLLTDEAIFAHSELEGYNIFYVDPAQVQHRIEAMPAVKWVRVTYGLPNHVTITLGERKPAAVWETQGKRYWVDQEGVFFPITTPIPKETLIIRDLDNRPVNLGVLKQEGNEDKPQAPPDPTAVLMAEALHRYLPERNVMDYSQNGGISFVTEGGWRVYFGNQVGLQAKVAIYQAFLEKRAPYRAVEFLDLSIPGQPYYKVRKLKAKG